VDFTSLKHCQLLSFDHYEVYSQTYLKVSPFLGADFTGATIIDSDPFEILSVREDLIAIYLELCGVFE